MRRAAPALLLAAGLALGFALRGAHEAWKPHAAPARAAEAAPAPALPDDVQLGLEALGYVSGVESAPRAAKARTFDAAAIQPGLTFVLSAHAESARVVDREGAVVHRWERATADVWPGMRESPSGPIQGFWRRAHAFDDGGLLAIVSDVGLVRLDRDSRVVWKRRLRAHHDLFVDDTGRIHVLVREERVIPALHASAPVLDDFVVTLDADGRELARVSIHDALAASGFARLWNESPARGRLTRPAGADAPFGRELFHTNTVVVLDGAFAGRSPVFARGNVLTSLLLLDTIAIVSPAEGRVVWARKLGFRAQHDPSLTDAGTLLVFDNGARGEPSRIWEFDPLTDELVWGYGFDPTQRFESTCCGAAQRLVNGNTLVTSTDEGRAFELDPDGRVVWEYQSADRALNDPSLVARLLEARRLDAGFGEGWLAAPPGSR